MFENGKVTLSPRKELVWTPLAKNVWGPAEPPATVQLVTSMDICAAPAKPPPPTEWKQPVNSASPQVCWPSAERSNSTQPQKPPRLAPQKSGVVAVERDPDLPHVVGRSNAREYRVVSTFEGPRGGAQSDPRAVRERRLWGSLAPISGPVRPTRSSAPSAEVSRSGRRSCPPSPR